MRYILILKNNSVMVFKIKACAELYSTVYGGKITETEIGV